MRSIAIAVVAVAMLSSFAAAVAAETKLPAPRKTGGIPVFEALDKRSSSTPNNFPVKELSQEELSTILWAASGPNRDGSKWTVPMAMGRPPYVKIYVLEEKGVSLYDWKGQALVKITDKDIRKDVILQDFAQKSPAVLLFVTDGEALSKFGNAATGGEFGLVLIGAMSMNVYHAAEGLDVGTRMIYSVKRDVSSELLKLPAADQPICIMTLGKR